MSASLADLAWVDVSAAGAVLVVPLGSTEQHGAHLPLTTDTDIALALCEALATDRPDVVVAPAVPYASSGEHAGFAGTLSIGQQALELLVLELGRSATGVLGDPTGATAASGRAIFARLVADLHGHVTAWLS